MHEMSITQAMLEIVREQMARNRVERIRMVRVQVGKLTAVEPDSLRFCFMVCTQGTSLEGAALQIDEVPISGHCNDCDREFPMAELLSCCPDCGGIASEIVAGRELDIVGMEA